MIDKEIVSLVNDLNEAGFITTDSCSGHGKSGYIKFAKRIPMTKAKIISDIFSDNAIDNIRFLTRIQKGKTKYSYLVRKAKNYFTIIDFNIKV